MAFVACATYGGPLDLHKVRITAYEILTKKFHTFDFCELQMIECVRACIQDGPLLEADNNWRLVVAQVAVDAHDFGRVLLCLWQFE